MNQDIFSTLEIDTIGEIMNISMGSAATAASTLLDNKVTITTPVVSVVPLSEFEIGEMAPAIAVDIHYIVGITGSNILILRTEDVRTILSQMMMTEIPADFEIDEMAESAICELMNQMMGSSATVLSCFLGRTINISTPMTVPIDKLDEFKQEHFGHQENILTIQFTLSIKDVMESQFVSVMDIDLAKEIISVSLNFDSEAASDDIASAPPPAVTPEPVKQAAPPPPAAPAPPPQAIPIEPVVQAYTQTQPYAAPPAPGYTQAYPPQSPPPQYPSYGYPPPGYPPQQQAPGYGYPPESAQPQSPLVVRNYDYGDFSQGQALPADAPTNLDLVMGVPVMVTVELGRTKRKIKEILEFGQGTIVELDKQAGSQVDVIVNGQLIARGDVVVVDDNFSIRITEILKNRDTLNLL